MGPPFVEIWESLYQIVNFLYSLSPTHREAATIQPVATVESQVVNIDASKKKQSSELSRIMGEMTMDDGGAGGGDSDLLDLMDS